MEDEKFKVKIEAELDTDKLKTQLKNIEKQKIKMDVDTGSGKSDIENIDKSIQSATKSSSSFKDAVKSAFGFSAAYAVASQGISSVKTALTNAIKAVQEYDEAIKDLRMATNDTYVNTSELVKTYNKFGQQIGATTREISSSADTWLRQGHSIRETNVLIKDSMMLSKIANIDAADSAKYLTSAMKGYNIEADKAINIVDKLVSVDLISATDAAGLAEGMSRTAESADLAGVSMDKLLGYLAATGEVTQRNMSSIGESFKTIFARMANIKAGKLELIDEDGTSESLSDVETVLTNLGIKLRESNNEFRNFGLVFDEVAAGWKNYSSVQQAAISKAFASVRQSENFKVLMENYSKATEYMQAAQSSSGTAAEKFDAYLDSIEAKTKSLQASFESLSINSISTETIGGVVDATNALVGFLNKTNMVKGSLAGLAAVGAVKGFTTIAASIHSAAIKLNEFNTALKLVKVGNLGDAEIQKLATLTANLSQSQQKAVLSSKNLSTQQRISILTTQGLSEAEAKAALSSMGLATAEGAATGATFTFSGALKGLWATLMANPLIIVFAAVSAAVSIFSSLKQKAEEARQAAIDAGNAAKEEASNIQNLHNAYLQASQAYKENIGSKEDLESATSELLKALGFEQSELDKLTEKYGNLDDAINSITDNVLETKLAELTSGYRAAVDALLNKTKDEWFSSFSLLEYEHGDGGTKFADVLVDNGMMDTSSFGSAGGVNYLGDNSSLEGVIGIYEKLIAMREKLNDGVSSGKYTREELADSGLYKAINNKINLFETEYKDVLDYVDKINSLTAQLQITKISSGEIPQTKEEFDRFRDSLVDSAVKSGEYVGTQEQIENAIDGVLSKMPGLTQVVNDYSDSVKQAGNTTTLSLSTIEVASDNINKLSSAFKELSEDGYITTKTIGEIQEATGLSGDEWEAYESKLLQAKAGSAEFNQVMSDLTYKMVDNILNTVDLTNATDAEISAIETKIAAMLRENNISNANETATFAVARAKETLRIKTEIANAATASAVVALATEAAQAGITGIAFNNLVLDIGIFNNKSLNVADKIAALQELGYYASWSAAQIASIGTVKRVSVNGKNGIATYDKDGKLIGIEEFSEPKLPEIPKITVPKFTNPSKSSKKDKAEDNAKKAADAKKDYAKKVKDINEDLAEKEKQFAENMEEAWKKEHLEALKDNLAERKDILDRYSKNLDILDSGLKLIDTNDFENKSTLLNQKMEQSTAYASALKAEFERVSQIIPQTGDEAQELASRLENLGSEMRSNTENMREALIEVTKLRFNMLASIGGSAFNALNKEFDNLDKRIESLKSGDSYAYRHADELLDYGTFLPTYSDFDRQRRKRQKQDSQLIDDTQKTQDKINKVVSDALKKQSQDNARAREKERQKLIEDMEKARQDAKEKLQEAKEDFDEKMSEIKDSAKEAIASVQDTINNADFKTPAVDTSETIESLNSAADSAEESAKRVAAAGKTAVDEWNKALSGRFDMGAGGEGVPAVGNSSVPSVGSKVNMSGFDMSASNKNECVWYVRNRARTKAGKNTGIYGNASTWWRQAKASSKSNSPKADSIACFSQDSKQRGYGHVVYIEAVSGDTIYYTEGGQGYAKNGTQGMVKQAKRSDFESKLFGSFQGYIDLSAYAQGTPYHTGGLAMLGDEGNGKFEAAILPDNSVRIIGRTGAEIVDLPKGTRVLPHDQTKKAFGNGSSIDGKRIPMYANGTGSIDVSEDRKNRVDEIIQHFTYSIDWLNRRMDEEIKNLNAQDITNDEKAQSAYSIRRRYSDDASKISSELGKEMIDVLKEYESKTDSGEWIYDTETYNTILDGIQDITDTAYEFADAAVKAKASVKELLDDKLSTSQDWISQRNFYGDWRQYGDSELRAIQRMRKYVADLYNQGMLSAYEFWEYEKELRQQEFTAGKDEFTNAVEAALSKAEEKVEERKEKLDFESSKYSSHATLLQSYYDVINAVRDARNDINKELRSAKAMYEYTNESTRKLLFNQGDFNALSKELNSIQLKANKLKTEYVNAIQGAEKENLEQITQQYQQQYETLMNTYEIAKADLDIAKKKQKLENVLAEKNVKMFVNGRWIWAANTQDVIDAQNELADAEYARETANDTLMQDAKINELETAQSSIATTINYLDSDLEKMRSNWDKISSQLGAGARSLGDILSDIANSDCPQLQNIFNAAGESIIKFVKKLTGETVSLEKTPVKESKWQGKGEVVYKQTSLPQGVGRGYASGTKHATSGLASLAEKYGEVVITNTGNFVPIDLPSIANLVGGEMVFNHEMTERLWNFAKQPLFISGRLADIAGGDTFNFGDIIVQNPANAKEVADNVVSEIVQGLKLRRRT